MESQASEMVSLKAKHSEVCSQIEVRMNGGK